MTLPLFAEDSESVELPMPAHRFGFLVTGANSSGKTTSVREALAPWKDDPRVRAIHPDHERNNDKIEDIEAEILVIWQTAATVVVVEGTNRAATAAYRAAHRDRSVRSFEALVALMEPDVMRARLQQRCAKRNKTFREDYWTERALRYEGLMRYTNMVDRHIGVEATTYWRIDVDHLVARELSAYLHRRVQECLAS